VRYFRHFWSDIILTSLFSDTNGFFTSFLPISSNLAFDNTGVPFNPQAILTNGTFDAAKYTAYSPLFITSSQCIAYGLQFASFMAVIVHTFLWYRRDISRRITRSLKDEMDVHSRLMQAYPEVPQLWYACMGVIALILMIVTVEIFPTQLPIWALFLALFLAALLAIPVGMLQAITNQQVALEVMHELIAGYMLPGRPVANMFFKSAAYTGTNQAVGFSGDLKLGHYMKIPPRAMFIGQVISAFVSCFVVMLVQSWMFSNITDFCSPTQINGFSCPTVGTFATASMIWGGVGPARLFNPGKM
jgi:OPT family oligopeptide transporter